jgi:L-ascorbate metabolism protein UlaG (beta-lactamase superfamily)
VHPDHFEEKTAALMGHTLPLYAQSEADAQTIASWGFSDVRIISDEGSVFGSLTLTRVPARHGLTPETDCGPASGVVLTAQGEPTLYLAGDTVWYQAVATNLERFRPEVTVLNCCGATLASRGRIIMDEEDVLAVCQAAPWTRVVASHMEAVNHGNISRAYLRTFCDRLGVGDQVLIPADGETLEF